MANVARRYLVSGRVQGVFFRASTRDTAVSLGLSGHAVNLSDGRVEVVAVGDADAVGRLGEWLRKGSPMSRVDDVAAEDIAAPPDAQGFRTGNAR